jgi:outer membrane biosynthesis protein TonB
VKLKLPEMKAGLTISVTIHAALLAWGLISFAVKPLDATPVEALPIDIISDKQFTEMAKGQKDVPKAAIPAPLVEKVEAPIPIEDTTAKITEKKEIKAAKAEVEPPPPEPEAKLPEPTPEKKPEPAKIDPIAETLKKEEARKRAEDKAKEAKAKAELQKQRQQPKFDPNQIAALLDKREPQRQAATGESLASKPSLGFSSGPAAQLSQSELDALRRRLGECWNPPAGAANGGNLKVVLRVLFKPDGSVATPPQLVAGTPSPYGPAMAESAKRAILSCQPFKMLRPEHYEQWKDIEITFDPRNMFGG